MRFEPVEVQEVQTIGNCGALFIVGDNVQPIAVTDLVEWKPMGKVAQSMRPWMISRSLIPLRPSSKRRSASEQKVTGGSITGGSSR